MKKRIMNILEPAPARGSAWIIASVLVVAVLVGGLVACEAPSSMCRLDDGFAMGSVFDVFSVTKKGADVRGLDDSMTPEDVIAYYGLTESDFDVVDLEASDSVTYVLENVYFDEADAYPADIQFHFSRETGCLSRVSATIRWFGAPWIDAHANALEIFDAINSKLGKLLTQDEWMQKPDHKGVVVNDFADPLDSLSEPDANFTRQYMFTNLTPGESFAVSMSNQAFTDALRERFPQHEHETLLDLTISVRVDW